VIYIIFVERIYVNLTYIRVATDTHYFCFSCFERLDKHLRIWYVLLHFPSPAESKMSAIFTNSYNLEHKCFYS